MSMPMSLEAYNEYQDELHAFPYGGYGNAMAQEAASYHNQGLPCPFSCGVCEGRMEAEYAEYEAQAEWDALTPAQRTAREIAGRMYRANDRFATRLRNGRPLRHQDPWGFGEAPF